MKEEHKTEFQKALEKMYEMGVEHGYQLATKDAEIKKLEEELQLKQATTE